MPAAENPAPSNLHAASSPQSTLRREGRRSGPRLPIKILDSYLFRQIVEATLRGLLMFVMLLLFFGVMTATKKLLENSVSLAGALQLIVYQLPRILLFTLPMSVLYGTLHAFADLSNRGEIIAMGAGGMTFGRMLRAPLIWAALLTVFAFWLQERIVPTAETMRDVTLSRLIVQGAGVQKNLKFSDEQPDGSSRTVSAETFDMRTKTLTRPVVSVFDKGRRFQSEISAARAQWTPEKGQWKFFNGRIRDLSESQQKNYDSADMTFREFTADAPNPMQLSKRALTRAENLQKGNFEFVSMSDLQDWQATIADKAARSQSDPAELERLRKMRSGAIFGRHDKIATPLICIALVFIAMPLGLRSQRSTGGFSMGWSLTILMLYYIVWTAGSQIGKAGAVNPIGAAYLPVVLTLIGGAILMWKKTR